jgi:hypothetical protein
MVKVSVIVTGDQYVLKFTKFSEFLEVEVEVEVEIDYSKLVVMLVSLVVGFSGNLEKKSAFEWSSVLRYLIS